MYILLFLGLFLGLVVLSFPVAFALGSATTVVMYLTEMPFGLLAMRIWAGLDKFALVAIPFFILAGELMGSAGILSRLLDFARLLVGRFKGGLLHVNIMTSMLFGGINGAAVADTSAVGGMLIPTTVKEYGDAPFVAAVTACSSVVGPIIPPSLPFIIYALVAQNVTVSGLFLGGVVPGAILGIGMMVITHFVIRKKNYPRDTTKYSFKDILRILRRFMLAFMMPVIMVGGIVSGIFTTTEAGCIAVVYALFVGIFITRELTAKRIFEAFIQAAKVSSVVMVMMAIANVAVWWLTTQQLPMQLSAFVQSLTSNGIILLILIEIMFLLLGIFVEGGALIIMLVPVIAPLCVQYGINPIHAGLGIILSITLGLVTPPVALSLFISSGIAKVPIEKVFKAATPLLILNVAVLFLVTIFPASWMWVPEMFGYIE